ncbi:MAG: nucleotidyltransferase family protein [Oscillospiraceae bacterium]|nr:nucleotidyltransferase family protein [Oscillospiraceae bacterium]
MTQEEYRAAAEDAVYLAACMVNGEQPDGGRVGRMDLDRLYRTADCHLLTGIVGCALEAAGVRDPAFVQARSKAVRRTVLFDTERAAVLAELEKSGIWHMPLKGCVLKDCYPQIGMRQMADNDILFDGTRADEVRAVMERLGFTAEHFGMGVHDSYFKLPVCNFEMHRALFAPVPGDAVSGYYRDIRSRMLQDEGSSFRYHLSPEDFYVYMIAHEHKHYQSSGTGLRSLLDTYVYLKKMGARLDFGLIAAELEKLGLSGFERQNRELSLRLFSCEALTPGDEAMFLYMLESGTYGIRKHSVQNQVARKGRWGYLWSRAFLPFAQMKTLYPVLSVLPPLLPLCWVLRLATAFLFKRELMLYQLRAAFGRPDCET